MTCQNFSHILPLVAKILVGLVWAQTEHTLSYGVGTWEVDWEEIELRGREVDRMCFFCARPVQVPGN
jgi:hypothetical protein